MLKTAKLIVRLSGGLGNQLFGYAAARRLALANEADLIIDPWSGFARDVTYRRQYSLAPFRTAGRFATSNEMLLPFERVRRAILKRRELRKPFCDRRYIVDAGQNFEDRLLLRQLSGTTYIEGVWPSESYFADMADEIRPDFELKTSPRARNECIAKRAKNTNSVAVHVRWFKSESDDTSSNMATDYYQRAFKVAREKLSDPYFLVFSDRPVEAASKLALDPDEFMLVDHNTGEDTAHLDLWLMSQCRHAILANSTFSWWGAWLGESVARNRIVIAPDPGRFPAMGWSSERLVPERWMKL